MVTYKEGPHAAAFILSEANGQRSRDNVEVPVGQKFPPGTVITGGRRPGPGRRRPLHRDLWR